MRVGDLSRCRNLSAFVWAEVKSVSSAEPPTPRSQDSLSAIATMARAGGYKLDDRACRALAQLSQDTQIWILSQVSPKTCRNPSAFVCSKIQKLQGAGMPIAMPGDTRQPGTGGTMSS